MDRLTYIDENGRPRLTEYGNMMYCSTQATADCVAKLEERLEAYKDTGLEPEELTIVRALCEDYVSAGLNAGFIRACINAVQSGMSTERITEITKAESEGRLVILPCKMGDTVWRIYSDGDIVESRISMLQQKADKTWKVRLSDYWGVHDVNINEIGKTIFLTREAAEATLGGDTE